MVTNPAATGSQRSADEMGAIAPAHLDHRTIATDPGIESGLGHDRAVSACLSLCFTLVQSFSPNLFYDSLLPFSQLFNGTAPLLLVSFPSVHPVWKHSP